MYLSQCTCSIINSNYYHIHVYCLPAGLSAVSSTTSMTPPPQARQPPSPSIVKVPRGVDKPPISATALVAARRLSESSTSSLGSARIPQV